jgi:hypothetical protein
MRIRHATIAFAFGLAGFGLHLPADAQEARRDPSLRVTLESAYNAWRGAMTAGSLEKWEKITAFSRQIETRNRIVSQRLPFPQAMFEDPVQPPALGGMTALGVLSTGETATSTYFGKANFGLAEGSAVADNMLVLHFLKEEGSWKFDNLRVVKLGNDAELLLKIRNGDFSFLDGAEFQPLPGLPPVPQPVAAPEYLAEAWIDSTGYEVIITVNGHRTGKFTNARAMELVIGGVKRGQNDVVIEAKRLEQATNKAPKVEIAIYATKDPAGQARRVYHFRPGATIPASSRENFVVE